MAWLRVFDQEEPCRHIVATSSVVQAVKPTRTVYRIDLDARGDWRRHSVHATEGL